MSRNENRYNKNRILIVGVGALGGTIATRALNAGVSVFMAVRNDEMARSLRFSGLRISGAGAPIIVPAVKIATIEQYRGIEKFNFILLATKAHEALELAPQLLDLLQPAGAIVSLQNGCVRQCWPPGLDRITSSEGFLISPPHWLGQEGLSNVTRAMSRKSVRKGNLDRDCSRSQQNKAN